MVFKYICKVNNLQHISELLKEIKTTLRWKIILVIQVDFLLFRFLAVFISKSIKDDLQVSHTPDKVW